MVVPNCDMGADGTFIFGDSGLEQNPDPEKLANIALSSAESFRTLTGKEPIVACFLILQREARSMRMWIK